MNCNIKNYQQILIEQIPYLKTKNHLCGGEGIAYFVDENFVIKKYIDDIEKHEFENQFELFCKEWQKYANLGFSIPKLYAWAKVLNYNYYSGKEKNKYNYYVLQERVKGRELFYGDLIDIYSTLKIDLPFDKYKQLINTPNINVDLFEHIVKTYLNYIIENNLSLANMSESELNNFIEQTYKIYMFAKYCKPDLHPSNVLIDKEKLTLIDPEIILENIKFKGKSEKMLNDMFLCEILNLFECNFYISSRDYGLQKVTNGYCDIQKEIRLNKEACEQAIRKLVGAVKNVCNSHKFSNFNFYRRIAETYDDILGEGKGQKLLNDCDIGLEL